MFGRTIWDKLPECIFENFEIAHSETIAVSKFSKTTKVIYPKSTWLLVKPKKQFLMKLIFLTAGNYKSVSGQLQNNSVNGAMLTVQF